MANSLRAKISKLRHDGKISDSEYQELIKKLDGHDAKVRADFKEEKCDKCDYFISVEEAYKQGRSDAIDECIAIERDVDLEKTYYETKAHGAISAKEYAMRELKEQI